MVEEAAGDQNQHHRDVARLKFTGDRFEPAGLPIEFASELENYQSLLLETAKELWRESHSHSSPLPDNFSNLFQLRLVAFEKGSFVPILERDQNIPIPELDTLGNLLTSSITSIDETFESIVRDTFHKENFSQEKLKAVKKFGSKLLKGESITFRAGTVNQFEYDFYLRKSFIENLNSEQKITRLIAIGSIKMLDNHKSFELRQPDSKLLKGKFSNPAIFDELHRVHELREETDVVWLDSECELDESTSEILKIKDVFQVGIFSKSVNKWVSRLAELARKPDGWLEGEGEHVELTTLETALNFLDELPISLKSRPSLFSDIEGNLRIEFLSGRRHTVISVNSESRFAMFHFDADKNTSSAMENLVDIRKVMALLLTNLGDS